MTQKQTCKTCNKRIYERGQTYTPGDECPCKTTEEMIEEVDPQNVKAGDIHVRLSNAVTKAQLAVTKEEMGGSRTEVFDAVKELLTQLTNSIHTQSALEAEGRIEDGETPCGNQELHETELAYNKALKDLADYHRSKVIE